MEIHCHDCGGFISEPERVSYRLPSNARSPAVPHSALSTCARPVVYGPPPGYLSSPRIENPDRPST
jgi:hypothetical protein